jgi:hypothetical protein
MTEKVKLGSGTGSGLSENAGSGSVINQSGSTTLFMSTGTDYLPGEAWSRGLCRMVGRVEEYPGSERALLRMRGRALWPTVQRVELTLLSELTARRSGLAISCKIT